MSANRDSVITNVVKELVLQAAESGQNPIQEAPASEAWQALRTVGTRLWLDTGDMDAAGELWKAEFEALTTNNTLLNKEIQKGLYDDLIGQTAAAIREQVADIDDQRLLLEIAFVLNARHGLALVQRFGARVSVELHTDLANDVERTVAYGKRFHDVCPDRFIVKVPLSPAGLIGARRLVDAGITINFTLGFSARQNVLSALVARAAYVNVFMGRLNAFVSDNKLGDGLNVGEKATLATQRELLALREAGQSPSLLIGASMREGSQVATLAGVDVFTMPPKVASEYEARPQASIVSRVQDDPQVTTGDAVTLADFAGGTLWDVSGDFRECARKLGRLDPMTLTPEAMVGELAEAGFGDLFPAWSEADQSMATTDGKIPVYAHWKDRLAGGEIGLDALMNLSAFRSFSADQAALDDRIRRYIS